MKTVIFVTDQFQTGGVESVFLNLANTAKQKIFLLPVHSSRAEYLMDSLPDNVEVIEFHKEIHRNVRGFILGIVLAHQFRRKSKLNANNCTVINFSDTLTTLVISFALNPHNVFSWIHCNPYDLQKSKTHWIYKRLLKRCKALIFICKSQQELFSHGFPEVLGNTKQIVCTNYLDIRLISKLKEKPIDFESPYFLMVARLDCRSKDFDTLFHGYSLLPQEIKEAYKMVVIGDGPDAEIIKEKADNYDHNHRIELIGAKTNPYAYMRHTKIFIHSSLAEGFSMVILEALACGCTVVASDCQVGPAEILDKGKYGYLFEPQNAQALSDRICRAIEAPISSEIAMKRAEEISNQGISEIKEMMQYVS